MHQSHNGASARARSRKKSSGDAVAATDCHQRAKRRACWIHACHTEAWRLRLTALSTGYSSARYSGPSLDHRVRHVYSPIIRTGYSPPSQLSTLNLVAAGRGFRCLGRKEGGKLVER